MARNRGGGRTEVAGDRGTRLPVGLLWAVLLGLSASACASTDEQPPIRPTEDLHHPNPSRRLAAVDEVGRRRELAWVGDLIELLDDPDPAVRMVAAGTLEDLTGRPSEYRSYESASERRRHQQAWRSWWRGRVAPAAAAPSAAAPAAVPRADPLPAPAVLDTRRVRAVPPPPPPPPRGGRDE